MKNLIHRLLTAVFLLLTPLFLAGSEVPTLKLNLENCEKQALENSPRIKASSDEQNAADSRAKAAEAQLYPRILIEGTYRYITTVPEIDFASPLMKPVKLGDNTNYSIGPSLYWTLWDRNGIRNSYKSFKSQADAKSMEFELTKRQVLLSARAAYFQVALAKEQVALLTDALKLAQEQYLDIKINVKAGTKSRMDELFSHQEVLSRMKQLRQARSDLSNALNELSSITGVYYGDNTLIPMDGGHKDKLPENIKSPTVYIDVEPADKILERFMSYGGSKLWENHPNVEIFQNLAESARLLSESSYSGLWPKFQLNVRSSLDYPNGPIIESFNQNTFGASLTWAIFEGSASRSKARENALLSQSNEQKKIQALMDLKKDFANINSELSNLKEQDLLNEASLNEAKELAGMVYRSYKAGAANYIDVQNANFKLLEAEIQSAKTRFRMLVNLAVMASLAE